MFKVIEKKIFIILLVACYIVIFSGLAKAGGMKSGSMGGTTYYTTSGMGSSGMGHNTTSYTTYNTADFLRSNSLLGYNYGYPGYGYNTYSPYSYSYGSALSPYSYGYGSSLAPYSYANAYSGLSPLSGLYNNYSWGNPYGATTSVVTGENYTQEQTYTQYVPGGEVSTTIGKETETTRVPISYGYGAASPFYGNLLGLGNTYNNLYGYGYGGLGSVLW
jgi:hypothetical protein